MTIEELRRMLFKIDNQDMTIQEIRHRLFEENDQQAGVTVESLEKILTRKEN